MGLNNVFRTSFVCILSGWLSACATHIPEAIKKPPAENLSLQQVQKFPDKHRGKLIRWGGSIISSQNREAQTELNILAQVLDKDGEPQQGDQSYGRFIAVVKGFLDPAIYSKGRAITVSGRFESLEKRKIDQFDYFYPIINAEHIFLWDVPEKYDYYHYPYWYDPWYPYYNPYWHHR